MEEKPYISLEEPSQVLIENLKRVEKLNRLGWLTRMLEAIGEKSTDSDEVRWQLMPYLDHEAPIVREGAIYGLEHHMNGHVRKKFVEMSEMDDNATIREIVRESLLNE